MELQSISIFLLAIGFNMYVSAQEEYQLQQYAAPQSPPQYFPDQSPAIQQQQYSAQPLPNAPQPHYISEQQHQELPAQRYQQLQVQQQPIQYSVQQPHPGVAQGQFLAEHEVQQIPPQQNAQYLTQPQQQGHPFPQQQNGQYSAQQESQQFPQQQNGQYSAQQQGHQFPQQQNGQYSAQQEGQQFPQQQNGQYSAQQQGHQFPQQQNGQYSAQQQPQQFSAGQSNRGYSRPNTLDQFMNSLRKKYNDLFHVPESQVPFNELPTTPNMSHIARACPRNGFFSGFTPLHMNAEVDVRNLLSEMNSTTEVLDMAMALRHSPDINPKLWYYALVSHAQKNPDLQVVQRMSPVDAMPDTFIPAEALRAASAATRSKRQAQCIVIDERFGADNGVENLLWYFRESIAANSFHFYFHSMYPLTSRVRESRRGELFYYMHSDIFKRYNAERLANGLARIQPIIQQTGAPLEGYYAHLSDSNSGFRWTDRQPNTPFNDVNHLNDPNVQMNLVLNTYLFTARDRIYQAIDSGVVYTPNGQRVSLMNIQGVDILGDLIQASSFSLNPQYFGVNSVSGLHGNGHVALSLESDPQFRLRLPPGVMADPATALRDVIFYRWHAFMNQIFDRHKATLPPYAPTGGQLPLLWPGVSVASVSVTPTNGGGVNRLQTFWSQVQFQLGPGLDLSRTSNTAGNSQFCAKQLDYGTFSYQILVDKASSVSTTRATVRIFLASRFDEQGNRFNMTAQRSLFFLLDSFSTTLNIGRNTITRRSTDSSLTVPWSQMLQQENQANPTATPYCGCGWPQNLLLPKGTPSGMAFDLLVMLTNGDDDAVSSPAQPQTCRVAPIFCGIANQLYPDAKPMGYPFDRYPYTVNGVVVPTLDQYMAGITNMGAAQVQITFTGQ